MHTHLFRSHLYPIEACHKDRHFILPGDISQSVQHIGLEVVCDQNGFVAGFVDIFQRVYCDYITFFLQTELHFKQEHYIFYRKAVFYGKQTCLHQL